MEAEKSVTCYFNGPLEVVCMYVSTKKVRLPLKGIFILRELFEMVRQSSVPGYGLL